MNILAIETSCDETAIAILDCKGGKNPVFKVISEALHSQVKLHEKYGGVFPMMAKREHAKNLVPLTLVALKEAHMFKAQSSIQNQDLKKLEARNFKLKAILEREFELYQDIQKEILILKKPPIDYIAVTHGPGLEPALWVGINYAKALGIIWGIPVVGINHMEGHIYSVLLNKSKKKSKILPSIALLISGGHTELVQINNFGKYKILGKTRDDAVGEAFDKVARILGLPYPGGPQISNLAEKARKLSSTFHSPLPTAHYVLPRPMIHSKDLDFSFSGLKTSVLYLTRRIGDLTQDDKVNIALEFENSVTEVLISKTKKALEQSKINTLIVSGGVSANKHIRKQMTTLQKNIPKLKVFFPEKKLSTDNAVMIGMAGYLKVTSGKWRVNSKISAKGNLSLEN